MPFTRITGRLAQSFEDDYKSNRSIRQIAHTHGVSYGSVHRHLTLRGVKLRRRGGRRKPSRPQ